MKTKSLTKAVLFMLILTFICGVLFTCLITVTAQLAFPQKANGSIIEIDGKKYGSELLAQEYTDEAHMWGRVMQIDVTTFKDEKGKPLMYAVPRNANVTSDEYQKQIEERVKMLQNANPTMKDIPVPVDLVTASGSGLDPHISIAAAEYQYDRLAKANDMSVDEIKKIVEKCTKGRFLGVFGEKTVNVLKVNLMIDGILK